MILKRMVLPPALIIYIILILGTYKKTSKQKLFIVSMIYFISVFIIMMTFLPIPVDHGLLEYNRNMGLQCINNLVPFRMIYHIIKSESVIVVIYQIGGNLMLLFPLGYLIPIVTDKKIDLKRIILIMFCITFCIENMQFIIGQILNFNYRCFDVDDMILNTSGGILGYLMLKKTYHIIRKYIKIPYFENEINII